MRQKCEACGVEIEGEQVFFSYPPNKPGTRARLRARVCQYAREEVVGKCINSYTEIHDEEKWKPI